MRKKESRYYVRLANDEADIIAAQRLRYSVFVEELGATGTLVDHDRRLEKDEFDAVVEHLLLVDAEKEGRSDDYVVGVYRLLRWDRMPQIGRYYSESEFDLSPIRDSGRRVLELGRSCVRRDFRGGHAMRRLWTALARYVLERDIEVLFGVASFHGTDPEKLKKPLGYLMQHHLAPPDLRVRAREPHRWEPEHGSAGDISQAEALKEVPSLIKAYLRLGGYVGEGAYVDHAFNTTDVCLIMDRMRMDERQRRYYTAKAGL